ncbi:MAG TPA: polyprenyl diphosphate synthase [Candidatus Saccharimonadia bacterium]|nr:polyprenyl diphosphate synthase [Candidatus Saccharimonadia bacterium]
MNQLNHIAVIPDGNTRWAKVNGRSNFDGYSEGIQRGLELTRHTRQLGIHTTTFWGLSTENWRHRPKAELDFLVRLFIKTMDDWLFEAQRDNVKIIHLGDKTRLPKRLLSKLAKVEAATANNTQFVFNLALDYGGQDEIMRATRRLLADPKADLHDPHELELYLDTAGQPHPNPDLIIRTSGEQRLSGFMPWQSVYAELYFEPCLYPDFTTDKLDAAIADYYGRKRNFGGGH